MDVHPELLKARLRTALTDRTRYPAGGLTLRAVMIRAGEIAGAVVDELAATIPARRADPKPPGVGRRLARSNTGRAAGNPETDRRSAANEKRQRLLAALAGGPLRYGEIQHRAQLTTGEATWLLKSTPGVIRAGDGLYTLAQG